MSLYDYEVFYTVASQNSFSKASRILHVTPSAVSHIIAKLENEFGFPLFSRNSSGVSLTSDGETMLPAIHDLLRCRELLEQEISDMNGMISGTVRLASFGSVTRCWIPDILCGFREKYPQVDVQLMQGPPSDVTGWINSGAVDLAFVTGAYRASEDIELIPLYKEPLVCVMSRDHETGSKDSVTPEDLRNETLIHSSSDTFDEIRTFIERYDLKHGYEYVLEADEPKLALAERGLGVCILPEMCADKKAYDIKVLPIVPASYRHIFLAVAHSRFIAPATEELKNRIIAYTDSK